MRYLVVDLDNLKMYISKYRTVPQGHVVTNRTKYDLIKMGYSLKEDLDKLGIEVTKVYLYNGKYTTKI